MSELTKPQAKRLRVICEGSQTLAISVTAKPEVKVNAADRAAVTSFGNELADAMQDVMRKMCREHGVLCAPITHNSAEQHDFTQTDLDEIDWDEAFKSQD